MLKAKNILLISPEPWDHIFVSKHNYAIHLAALGNKVFFLDPPGQINHFGNTTCPNVFSVKYTGFLRGVRFLPGFLRRVLMRRVFKKLAHLAGATFDVVWSFDTSVFFDFSFVPAGVIKILHVVDLNQDFQLARAATTADICFCTSDVIRQKLARFNPKVFKINHGCTPFQAGNVVIPGSQKVKAVYAGNLTIPYLDWQTMAQCVAENAMVDFVFIGPGREKVTDSAFNALCNAKNAFFVGKVEQRILQGYYEAADVLLVCYRQDINAGQVSNPHKLMQYLAAGKVIVATYTAEYSGAGKIVLMSQTNVEYPGLLKRVLQKLDKHNHPEQVEMRKSFAFSHTYDKQIERIERLLTEHV